MPDNPVCAVARLEPLWLQVCAARGTPAPEPQHRRAFLQQLDAPGLQRLQTVLELSRLAQEPPGGLSLLSWAAACTRRYWLQHLADFGLHFLSADLFCCSLSLIDAGWDMPARLSQLAEHPEDVEALRALMVGHAPADMTDTAGDIKEAVGKASNEEDAPSRPALGPGDFSSDAQPRSDSPMSLPDWGGLDNASALPDLPTRFLSERHEGNPNEAANVDGPLLSSSLSTGNHSQQLRLYGKGAAHTLEITSHRRGNDFLGVHVITVDSAHALPGGGFDWKNKLVLQLTPEEMPAVIATLIGITASVKFGNHGADRSKFVEMRRQAGGLVMVTGEHASVYSVPVPTASLYYVLDLFCRAMCRQDDRPGRSVGDILAMVKAAHGF